MSKRISRLTAIFVSVLLVFSVITSVIAQALPAGWKATYGSPQLKETVDGDFCSFYVDSTCTASTDEAHNMLTEAIVIRNFSYAPNHWSFIGLSPKAEHGFHFNNAKNGKLGFFIEAAPEGIKLIFNATWTQVALVEKSDIYTIRFVKNTDGVYGLQVNGVLYNHSDIDKYCKSGKTKSYINLFAQNWMKGEIKVGKLDLMQSASVVSVPEIKESITGDTDFALSGGSVVSTTAKVDWNTQKVSLSNVKLSGKSDKFCISLNKVSASKAFENSEDDGSLISVVFSPDTDNGKLRVSLAAEPEIELGTLEKASGYSFGIVKSGESYALAVNSTLFLNERFDGLMSGENAGLTYISLSATDGFSGSFGVYASEWAQIKGTDADIKTETNDSCSFELTDSQVIQSPRRYDFLDSDIVLSQLNIVENGEISIYVGKDSAELPPAALSESGVTFILKKNGEKISLSALNADKERIVLGSAEISDKYIIGVVKQNEKLYFKINDNIFETGDEKFTKFTDEFNNAIGGANVFMAFYSVAASGKASANISIVMREHETKTAEGFSVITPGGIVPAAGDDENGYSADYSSPAYALTVSGYDMIKKSLRARVTDVGSDWMWLSVSKTGTEDGNVLPSGNANSVSRCVFIITPKNNYSLAQISYWNANGSGGETIINTVKFDWTAEHTYDIRKGSDGKWYLAIDEQLQSNISSPVLNGFMEANSDNLHYGIGGFTTFKADKINIVDQSQGGGDVETTGWGYFSSAGGGSFKGDDENGYSKDFQSGNIFGLSREKYNISEKTVQITLDDIGDWFWFGVSATGAEDTNPLPNGNGANIDRFVFIITPKVNRTKAQISYWNANGSGGEHVINLIDFDWKAPHTYDIRKGSDGHFYIAVDSKLITGLTSDVLNEFVALNQDKGLKFAVGGMGKFVAKDIKVIAQESGDITVNTDGWRYFSSIGNGDFEGNDKDGYSVNMLSGDLFAFTKNKYSITKTGVTFKLSDIRNWLYFSISATPTSDTNVLQVGPADKVNRISFIITPKIGATRAQFSYWGQNGKTGETVIQEINFGWYDEHTLDVRKDADDGHWYLCIDGRVLSRKYSAILDEFMELNNPEELYYGIGGSGCFGAADIKIVNKPPIAALEDDEENGVGGGSGSYVPEDYDFDFSDEHESDDDFSFDDSFDDDSYIDAVDENVNAGKVKVRIKMRKLVEKGHGIIFTVWEKIGMAAGAAAVLSGLVLAVIFIIRKAKSSKKKIQPLE